MSAVEAGLLLLTGFFASVLGSLVGLGGGFVAVPVLRAGFHIPPALVAGTSLLFVFANGISATLSFLRDKKIDFSLGVPFVIGAIPGGVVGVILVHHFTPVGFDTLYAGLLAMLSVLVVRRRNVVPRPIGEKTFAHDPRVGIPAGFITGVASSLFGVGGGVVFVPLLLIAARLSPFVVTATAAFIIACTAPVGIIVHAIDGDIDWLAAIPLVLGGLAGGTVGPIISRRIASPQLVTTLAFALALAAVGLVVRHLV